MKKLLAALALTALSTSAMATTATIYSYDQVLNAPEVADPTIYAHVDVVKMVAVSDFDFDNNNALLIPGVQYDEHGFIYYTGEGSQPREVLSGEVVLNLECNFSKEPERAGFKGMASIAITLEPGAEYELYAVHDSKAMGWFGAPKTNFYRCVPGIRKR
ncbi:hypothetical protein L1077_20640 [Pseudoalteromonas luteoviolacea]|uniref:hypothetical protein n=1 Tax=Pseudoalteromonas luteoviolacea TaxID=43657 RepID=UPI001F3E91D3|nr:hypothetical protein [Pseudoalteromonas luteoviolacea]MCF6441848.1 hypothetical protein [Pseudoalteromonas luteoviolacea]